MASIFYELSQLQGFKSLLQESKDFFKHVCEQQDPKSKKIYIDFEQTNLFYCESTFESPSISDILNFFDDISIEIDYSSKVYDSIYKIISKLKRTSVPKMKIIIIITLRRDIGKSFIDNDLINEFIIDSSVTKIKDHIQRQAFTEAKITNRW